MLDSLAEVSEPKQAKEIISNWGHSQAHDVEGWVESVRDPDRWEGEVIRWQIGYRKIDHISKCVKKKGSHVSHRGEKANKYRKKKTRMNPMTWDWN